MCEAEIDDALARRGAVLVEGVRWCGKTWAALRFARSALRLDDEDALVIAQADPVAALAGDVPRLVDEWQNAPHLWNRIRRECDERAEPGQFILTRSASPHSDITRHTGTRRIARVTLRPMSLFESSASHGAVSLRRLFDGETASCAAREDIGLRDIASFVCVGGWPANLDVAEDTARRSARDHLTESVLVDVPEASGVRHRRETMLALTRSVARNVATEARTSRLLADMYPDNGQSPVARQTATACLEALRRVFVLEDQPAWLVHLRSRAVLRKSPKRHFVDPSLAAAALGASPEGLLRDTRTLGFLFESLVIRDLRVYSSPQQASVYHYRDSDNLEVDAIVSRDDGAWLAAEVKLSHHADSVDKAAASLLRLRSKVSASRRAQLAALVVITARGPAYRRPDGVCVTPITSLGP